jgi:hypothetical protein
MVQFLLPFYLTLNLPIMKKFTFLAALSIFSSVLFAQSSPWVGTPTVNPQVIAPTGQVTVITTVTTSTSGNKVSATYSVNNSTKVIDIEGCYAQSMLPALKVYTDTFKISSLQPGVYTIRFQAIQSASMQTCQYVNSNTVVSSVTVTGNPVTTGIIENNLSDGVLFFPNPVQNRLHLDQSFSGAEIMALNGSVVKKITVATGNDIDVTDLSDGVYIISFTTGGKTIHRKFVKQGKE